MTTTMRPAPERSGFERVRRSSAGVAVTDAGKAVLRAVGEATASSRPGPELLIVGAKRGGTTSLWRYLIEHPGVLPTFPAAEKIKGTYYFDENFAKGRRWYLSHFPTTWRRTQVARRLGYSPVTMEASAVPRSIFWGLSPLQAPTITQMASTGKTRQNRKGCMRSVPVGSKFCLGAPSFVRQRQNISV